MAFRLLLLLIYSFFFSVQVCFRYTNDAFDTDAFQSSFVTAQIHSGHHGPSAIVFSKQAKDKSDQILNKRFQPGDNISYIPSREFLLSPSFVLVSRKFYSIADPTCNLEKSTISSRGPPSPAC